MRNVSERLLMSLLLAAMVMLAGGRPARADHTEFFETYGYFTARQGELELELWNDFFNQGRQQSEEEHAGHLLSLEYGINNRWMVEFYGEWRDNPNGHGFQYTRSKVETRYRLGDYHPNGINTALYLEYEKSHTPLFDDELEGKLILQRDFGQLTLAANAIFEKDLVPNSKIEFGYAVGLSYPVSRDMIVSLETLVKPMDRQVFIIPGVHFPIGKNDWAGIGVSFQTSPAPFNATLKTFIGHEF